MQINLQQPEALPDKGTILERLDPPVLIIHVRWHETEHSFGKLLRDLLYFSYAGNEHLVGAIPSVYGCDC